MKESFFARLRKVLDTGATAYHIDFDTGVYVPVNQVLNLTHFWIQAAHSQPNVLALEARVSNPQLGDFSTLVFSPSEWSGETAKVRTGGWSGDLVLHHDDHISATVLLSAPSIGCKFSISIDGYLLHASECGYGLRVKPLDL